MSIEDTEMEEMPVEELIDIVEENDIPTSEFTVEDTDRMVILGKLNTIIEWLKTHGYGTNIFSDGEYLEEYNIDLKLDKSVYDAFILALDDILEDIADALENIPTKTSDLINDSGFVDSTALALYQLLINASNPLSADFVNDSETINKFVRAEDIVKWNGKQNALTFDDFPTLNSQNPVTSNGIYNALIIKSTGNGSASSYSSKPVTITSSKIQYRIARDGFKTIYGYVIWNRTNATDSLGVVINFGTSMSNTDYAVSITPRDTSTNNYHCVGCYVLTKTTTSATVLLQNVNNGTYCAGFNVIIQGY